MKEVDREFDMTNAKFSYYDVQEAVEYAFSSVAVSASEVGTEVYGELIHEKMVEYLNGKMDE